MTFLAIDLGGKRTGIAVGDDDTGIASPVVVIQVHDEPTWWRRVREAIADQQPDALVVGLPLNMDGTEGFGAQAARAMARRLAETFEKPVHLVDERLTSAEADDQMAGSGLTRYQKKRRRDALAAAAILRTFFALPPEAREPIIHSA